MSDQEHHLRTIIETLERENAALRALTKEASLALDGNWHERVDMIKKLDAIDDARQEEIGRAHV